MSEHITHIAICDDCLRLCQVMCDLPEAFHRVSKEQPDAARMGGVTRQADKWSAEVIDYLRQHPSDSNHDRKLAFILGALTHRSIDRHMKPVFVHFKQSIDARKVDHQPINECTAYCDMLILQKVYGVDHTFSKHLFDPAVVAPTRAFQELLRVMLQRTLIQMHTFKPDSNDVQAWMSSLFAGMQDFSLQLDLYDDIANRPDALKWNRYLIDANFYNETDPLIVLLRRLQHGHKADESEVNDALEQTTSGKSSRYANAVRRAAEYFRAAGQLYQGQISVDQIKPLLDIGVPELAMGFGGCSSS